MDHPVNGLHPPPLASLPPAEIRLAIAPPEWEACLDAWLIVTNLYLNLSFRQLATDGLDNLVDFLPRFYQELASAEPHDGTLSGSKAQSLRRQCFMLFDRMISEDTVPPTMLQWKFLSNVCRVHMRSAALSRLMATLWKRRSSSIQSTLQNRKKDLTALLESPDPGVAVLELVELAPVMRASADIGAFFLTGTDFMDALSSAYTNFAVDKQRVALVTVAYLGLLAQVKLEHANLSALSDALYGLKAQADRQGSIATLLADLITNTPLVGRLRQAGSGAPAERLHKLLDTLELYRMPSIERGHRHRHRKMAKGKRKATHVNGELHVHRMSLVGQIQDLFPDLGAGFVLRLLDEYGDNVEQVTAHLLDDSLPPHLQSLERSEQAPIYDSDTHEEIDHLAPRSTPPPPDPCVPDRRNVFDDDEILTADAAHLHIGKRADRTESLQPNKAAILSALAAFDADDDERDDTYDVEDVGGTVDTAHPDGEPGTAAKVTLEENEMALFNSYKATPELFGRTFDVRRGQARSALKAETGMTDEAIEGWAIMLQRDPRRAKKLEERFTHFNCAQPALASTAYRDSEDTEDSDAQQSGRSSGFRGRGRGGRGRGGGRAGGVAGPSSDPSTAAAQRRKEANKSSRANHNRRDQRARKMARGGFAG
ncbi:hypothetical protein BAUCODRAFT_30456 [Baudoinia panamericana UAMH 10762]|uniref:CUE domain-containing protein n=1 Tax=Baudoinia panamericana (strain UAMH 10762) TaxID=717646 RepID=M2NKQ3_BAUPA|nr:uncharacterized protein BAUCODRAFT_30456 [Baudoinia panamericana UAMH 10762]EMD00015.1 hypothetical protein BAUCODRAFT_30456 [Baudoinia panamericana UAMH 10762]